MIDTGGIEPKTDDIILAKMKVQAEIAIDTADVIVFMTAKRFLMIPGRAMFIIPAWVCVMQIIVVLVTRSRNFKNVNFWRPAIL